MAVLDYEPHEVARLVRLADITNRVVGAALRAMPKGLQLDPSASGMPTTDGGLLYEMKEIAQALEDGRLPWAITAAALEALGEKP